MQAIRSFRATYFIFKCLKNQLNLQNTPHLAKGTFLITYHHRFKHKHLRYLLLPSKLQVQIHNFTFIVLKKKNESNTTNTKCNKQLVHEDETMTTYFIKVLHKISLQ